MIDTIDYYNTHAASFVAGTLSADMSGLRSRFLRFVPAGGRILDAGCGSGRDSLAFLEAGFQVDAFDASETLCRIASERLGFPVKCTRFEDLAGENEYDGIWACASLLHVAAADLSDVMERLCRLLKPGGAIYVSFKEGDGERTKEGRYFHDMTADGCRQLLEDAGLEVLDLLVTDDVRKDREGERWVNAVGRKAVQKD